MNIGSLVKWGAVGAVVSGIVTALIKSKDGEKESSKLPDIAVNRNDCLTETDNDQLSLNRSTDTRSGEI